MPGASIASERFSIAKRRRPHEVAAGDGRKQLVSKPEPTTMALTFAAAQLPPRDKHRIKLGAPFLAATSLTFLKPRLKAMVRPLAAKLAGIGVTANQVTLASLVGSITISAVLCAHPSNPAPFALLPLWLPVRTACAALDGTLAIEFGQKSRLGGVLNEVGDIVADAALFLPLCFVAPFSTNSIIFLISLIALAEIAGIVGPSFGSDRRLEGPLGKADRSIILAILGLIIATLNGLPESAELFPPVLYGGLILTIWNRLRFAIADEGKASE
jgi:CDP-diacylglycerol--glycerol-3-phosphate 3-phosphatidyltransferase